MSIRAIATLGLTLVLACRQEYELTGEPDVDPLTVTECGFTRIDNTAFYAYDCNPVFTTTGEGWANSIDTTTFYVTEVLGHPFYQLWYTGTSSVDSEGDYGLGYAVSANGTDWTPAEENPLLEEPPSQEWDHTAIDALQVVWDPDDNQYVMIFQGYNLDDIQWGLGVATSPDGKAWTRNDANPVVDFMEPSGNVTWCWPLGLSLGSVGGFEGYVAGGKGNGPCEAYAIHASDINSWTPDDQVVFSAGDQGTWDDEGQLSLATAELDGTNYLFYVGFGDWQEFDTYRVTQNQFVGMATSSDGLGWTRQPEPIPLNQTEDGQVGAVAARTVGSRIHLWVSDTWDDTQGVGYFLYDPERAAAD